MQFIHTKSRTLSYLMIALLAVASAACWDVEETHSCAPNETFVPVDGCGSCLCPTSGNKGEADCTAIGCPEREQCTPGETFDSGDGCNHCICPETGLIAEAVCTADGCWDTCKPGETFPSDDGCSTCTCPQSGLIDEAICRWESCNNQHGDVCDNSADCAEGLFCKFSSTACGIWEGTQGQCTKVPDTCVAGGPGACGCNGQAYSNSCEAEVAGGGFNAYGGCSLENESTVLCGNTACDKNSEYCQIALHDAVGDDEPAFYANCIPFDAPCLASEGPHCACIKLQDFQTCTHQGPLVTVLYPGG